MNMTKEQIEKYKEAFDCFYKYFEEINKDAAINLKEGLSKLTEAELGRFYKKFDKEASSSSDSDEDFWEAMGIDDFGGPDNSEVLEEMLDYKLVKENEQIFKSLSALHKSVCMLEYGMSDTDYDKQYKPDSITNI